MLKKDLYINSTSSESKIFFTPKYHPSSQRLTAVLRKAVFTNKCSRADIENLYKGEIRIYFNPTVHKAADRKALISKVCNIVKTS